MLKDFFKKLKEGLSKTSGQLTENIETIFLGKKLDDETLSDLEDLLITADIGMAVSEKLIESLRKNIKRNESDTTQSIKNRLKEEMLKILQSIPASSANASIPPKVVLCAGVNGVGKTTTIGKLAKMETEKGKKVMLAAADTFRAAAIEQLEIWGKRAGAPVIKHRPGADPAGVVFDAINAAKAKETDILFVDTAGRLHTKTNLMEELKKIVRVAGREKEGAPDETLLILDATTGQNALSQVKLFSRSVNITGLILTKLDGTAKGGIIISIADEMKIPIKYIGVGEKEDDLQPFVAEDFVEAIL